MNATEQTFLSQLQLMFKTQIITKQARLAALLISLLLIALQFKVSGVLKKTTMLTSSLVLLYVGNCLSELDCLEHTPKQDEQIEEGEHSAAIAKKSRASIEPLAKTAESTPTAQALAGQLQLFDWHNYLWHDFHKAVHFAVVGTSDDCQNTIKVLCAFLPGYKLVLDANRTRDNWQPLPSIGAYANYQQIVQTMQALLQLVKYRNTQYSVRYSNYQQFEPITIVLNNYLAIANHPLTSEIANEFVRVMLFEGRKVFMRLVIQSQSARLETLGLQDFHNIREDIRFIRSGKPALTYARSFRNQDLLDFLQTSDRPCMFGRLPTDLSNISKSQFLQPCPMPADLREVLKQNTEYASSHSNLQGNGNSLLSVYTGKYHDLTLARKCNLLLEEGHTRTWIIENILGYQGSNFNFGKARLKNLLDLLEMAR